MTDLINESNIKVYNYQVLGVTEVCDILKCSKTIAYQLIKKGLFPSRKIGKSYSIPAEEFWNWYKKGDNYKYFKRAIK